MAKRRVLVTGAAGYIASQVLPALRERYDLVLIDKKKEAYGGKVLNDVTIADLLDPDLDKYRKHFKGVQAVVHLTFNRPPEGRKASYFDERANVDMAYNVYQVSFDEGVERVVAASSNHAADWYEHLIRAKKIEMLTSDVYPLSDNYYGWAKIAYETLGFIFSTGALGRKMGIVELRIGAPREIDVNKFRDNPQGYKRDLGAYMSQRDFQQLVVKSIETESIENEHGIPFQIFYGVSDNARSFWSIANARRVIGYEPQDDSEAKFAKDIREFLTGNDPKIGKL
jgi:nucleoside-diphosphate-sugar epimerase